MAGLLGCLVAKDNLNSCGILHAGSDASPVCGSGNLRVGRGLNAVLELIALDAHCEIILALHDNLEVLFAEYVLRLHDERGSFQGQSANSQAKDLSLIHL